MKVKSGFTLVEVLIAIFILGSSIFVLTDLQIRSVFRVLKDREEIDRMYLVKKDLYAAYANIPKQGKKQITQIEEPKISIATEIIEIGKKSAFKDFKEIIHMIQTKGEWVGRKTRKRDITMMTLVGIPSQEKKEKK